MFFLNFTVGEFVVLFAALAGVITALYLLDRSKNKKVVSTLRFWTSDAASAQQKSRNRLRDPWSFLLQVLSMLLLLLAIGQLQWGSRERASRKHVLLIDTSAWSSEFVNGRTLLDTERKIASEYLGRLPAADQILLVGVDAFATPATLFTTNRAELLKAVGKLQSSYSALDIGRALSFAQQTEAFSGDSDGEVVYIGPGRIQKTSNVPPALRNLRTIFVQPEGEDCGIRSVGLRRDDGNSGVWRAVVTIENYGRRAHALQLTSEFPGRVVASRQLTVGAHEQVTVEYGFTQPKNSRLTTHIEPDDALRADDRVTLSVPGINRTRLAVFTSRPNVLKPLIQSDRNLEATFSTPGQYNARPAADAILLDRMSPPEQPRIPALWIDPPRDGSPVPVEEVVADSIINAWMPVKAVEVFQTRDRGDTALAGIAKGPVIVAHRGVGNNPKFVVIGYDPLGGELRFQATAPLVFANLLRWLCPESRQLSGVNASFVGETTVPLTSEEAGNVLSVSDDLGASVPFDVHDRLLEFFADRQSPVRIQFRTGERLVSPVVADVAEDVWTPPSSSTMGLPPSMGLPLSAFDLWKWLALAGGLGLLADWLLFGQKRPVRQASVDAQRQKDTESELVHR